jgi:hypothetical protein
MTESTPSNADHASWSIAQPTPSWTTVTQAMGLFWRGATFSTAAPVAIVVGTLLSLVNQLQVVLDGDATWATWVRIVVNYAVPYLVASIGFLSACRARPRA